MPQRQHAPTPLAPIIVIAQQDLQEMESTARIVLEGMIVPSLRLAIVSRGHIIVLVILARLEMGLFVRVRPHFSRVFASKKFKFNGWV